MDIQMGGLDGISATERITKKYPEARVVIVSQFDDDSFRASARDAGAVGFVSKERLYEINDLLVEGAGGVPTQV
jgi:two-component system response regulator DegU